MAVPSQNWFPVAVKPRYETCVAGMLEHKDVSAWRPLSPQLRRYAARTRVSDSPFSPKYVFCPVPSGGHSSVLTTAVAGAGIIRGVLDSRNRSRGRLAVTLLRRCLVLEAGSAELAAADVAFEDHS